MVPLTSCFVGFRVRGASLRVNGTLFFLEASGLGLRIEA